MNLLYHLPILPPKIPQAEALSQEIAALRARFGGELCYLNPNQRSPIYIPRLLFGFHKLQRLRAIENKLDLHHFYNPDPFPYPILRYLRKPVIYTISSGLGNRRLNINYFKSMAAVVVADHRSLKILQAQGIENCHRVRPGIDTTRYTYSPLPLESKIKVMVASAPWTPAQFQTKGVDALLAAVQQARRLHLIFLWRGVLKEEMVRRVRQLKLEKQVTILDKLVDVNHILAGVHATINLATASAIIKAYPHSLLDSLAAGKPVLVSQALPMADYVKKKQCGVVVNQVTPAGVLTAIEALVGDYQALRESARQVGQRDFSLQGMLDSYRRVYEQIIK